MVFAQDPARGAAKLTANLYLLGLCLLAYNLTLDPVMRRRSAVAWTLAAAVSAAGLVLAVMAYTPDLGALTHGASPGSRLVLEPSPRLLIWQSAAEGLPSHPIVGRGLGAAVADVDYLTPSGVQQHHGDAHNVWLSIAGQAGALGLAAFVALVVYLLRGLRGADVGGPDDFALRGCLTLALVTVLYHSLSISSEETRHVWLLFGVLAAALDSAAQHPDQTGLRFSMKARRPSA